MFKRRKRSSVLAWMLAAALSVSMIPSYTALAADDDSSATEDTDDSSAENTITITIDGSETDPASAIVSAVNNAEEDTTIYLTEEAADGKEQVVYSFEEALVVPEDISVSIVGQGDAEYVLQAGTETAVGGFGSITFVTAYGSLTLDSVTIDANEMGRALVVYETVLEMKSGAVVMNGSVTNASGAGIDVLGNGSTVTIGEGCYVKNNTLYYGTSTIYGAGIYVSGKSDLYLEEGSHVSDNQIKLMEDRTSTTVTTGGAGIYASNMQYTHLNGCYIENNTITAFGAAYGAGIMINSGSSTEYWSDVTVTGNQIICNFTSTSKDACGAGIYMKSASSSLWLTDSTIEGNSITGEDYSPRRVWGAGICLGTSASDNRLTNVSVTGNTISVGESSSTLGAGIYGSEIYISGDMVISDNWIEDAESNYYSNRSLSTTYPLYLLGALGEDADVSLEAAYVTSSPVGTGTFKLISGAEDYTLTTSDYLKLSYDNTYYRLSYEDGLISAVGIYDLANETLVGQEVHVKTSAQLVAAVLAASSVSPDEEDGGTTDIIVDNNIELQEPLILFSGRYATITSNEGGNYTITAGAVLDDDDVDAMIYVLGSLELTDITLDGDSQNRVIKTSSDADLKIGENAVITGGSVSGNGQGIYNAGTLVIEGGSVINNGDVSSSSYYGGGIYNTSAGMVTITDGTITGNAAGRGGGIYTLGAATISGTTKIADNTALVVSDSDDSAYTGGYGGGIYMAGDTVTLSGQDVVIENNESMWGGGIFITNNGDVQGSNTSGTLNIEGAVIQNNKAHISSEQAGSGGGIYMHRGAVVNMSSGVISGNTVVPDETVDTSELSESLQESLIQDGYGGGIYVSGQGAHNSEVYFLETEEYITPVLNLTGGTITGNEAYEGGSGVYVANYTKSSVSITNRSDSGYRLAGSGILNVSGSPVVSGNEGDDILLAAAKYINDDEDWNAEFTYQISTKDHVSTGLRQNIIYPVYLHIVGELTESANLHVSKELLTYDASTVYVADNRQTVEAFDSIIVEGSGDYGITEENLDDVLDIVDIEILTEGFWQLSAATVDVSDDSDDDSDSSSDSGDSSDGSEDTSSALTAIEGISLTVTTAVADGEDLTYTGSALTPEIVVTAAADDESSVVLTADTDYEIEYEDNTDAGTATYTITGTGLYQGTVTGEFTIEGKSLTDEDVTVALASELCLIDVDSEEAQVQTPAVTVTANGTKLTQDEDYTVTYADNASYGTAAVTVTGTGNYTGTVTKTFSIRYSGACLSEETDADGNTILCYETDGVVQSDYTGLVTEDETTYYVVNGVVDSDFTGLVTMDETTYYIAEGIWDSDYTGLVTDDEDAVWYVVDGVVDAAAETAVIDDLLYAIEEGQAALYTGLYDGLYYENGALYTGELDGLYYENGVLYTGELDGLQYVDGALYTGELDGLYYENGTLYTGELDGLYYENGVLYTGELDGLQYVDGALYTGELDGLYYKDGTLYTGTVTVDGINYTVDDGVMSVHADTLSVRRGNIFYFSYTLKSGNADKVIAYGKATDEVLIGDWDGDGVDTVCVRRGNTYYFSNSLKSGNADTVIAYGKATDEVLVGDWDGDGKDTLAVRRGNTYYIANSLKSGNADSVIAYGKATDTVLVGKWSGNLSGAGGVKDTLAVRRGNTYYFSNSLKSGNADKVVAYGKATDEVLSGDWNGDGYDTLTVRRGNIYYFSNSIKSGNADTVIAYGKATDEVYVGTWK